MNNIARVFATGIIWGALTILGIAATVSHVELSSGALTIIMAMLIIGATIGTGAVWKDAGGSVSAKEEAEKAKRRSRVERLMSDLDERDIDELRYRLMGDSDEDRIPLDELISRGQGR
jgi:hypothetical protein